VGWLPASNVALPLRGRMTLQVVAVAVLAIGIAEIWTRPWRSTPGRPE